MLKWIFIWCVTVTKMWDGCKPTKDILLVSFQFEITFLVTNKIYNNLFKTLKLDKRRKFTIGHMGYLKLWYRIATQDQKENFLSLVQRNQIEFSNGASVAAPDEATTYYLDLVDNFRAGAQWFHKNIDKGNSRLEEGPGWMIDSFGHSLVSMRL